MSATFMPQQQAYVGQHTIAQQGGQGIVSQDVNLSHHDNGEALEMAAFEKGRIQGEMEAMRRLEQEGALKGVNAAPIAAQTALPIQPEVLEIHRLTWLQRLSFILGVGCNYAMLGLTIAWLRDDRGGFAFDETAGDRPTFNTFLLCTMLSLFFMAHAYTVPRVLPTRTPFFVNFIIYCFFQAAALASIWTAAAAYSYSAADQDNKVWAAAHYCWLLAAVFYTLHALYSMTRLLFHKAVPVSYEEWAEVNNRLTSRSRPLKKAKHDAQHAANMPHGADVERTVYAPQPRFSALHKLPAAKGNVPHAPANAPRWAENPHTHAEDFFFTPRKRWGVTAFWTVCAAFLMALSGIEIAQAVSAGPVVGMSETGREHRLIGALGLMTLFMTALMSYVAIPPRATLVKQPFVAERELDARRTSLSNNQQQGYGQQTMV